MQEINYKDGLNKVLETKLLNYKRKLIKENIEPRRRILQVIQEAKHSRESLIKGEENINNIMRLFGQ
jgi:hypothetical protein